MPFIWSKLDAVVFGASQDALQELSKGRHKWAMAELPPVADQLLRIRGPVLEAAVVELLSRYDFRGNQI